MHPNFVYDTLQFCCITVKNLLKNNWILPNFFLEILQFLPSQTGQHDCVPFRCFLHDRTGHDLTEHVTNPSYNTNKTGFKWNPCCEFLGILFSVGRKKSSYPVSFFFSVDSTLLACVARAYGTGKKKHVRNRNPNKLRQRKFIKVQLPCYQMNLFNFHTVGDICNKTKWSLMNVILKYLTVQLHSVHWFLRKGTDPIAATAHTVPCFRVTFSLLQFFSPSSGCCPRTRSVIKVAHKSLSIFWRLQQ